MINRNTCVEFAYNSRLDTIQAVIARYLIKNKLDQITNCRIKNSIQLDESLKNINEIKLVGRSNQLKEVFHLYMFKAKDRDGLYKFLQNKGIDAKIHYPIPMHLQPAAKYLGYKYGDFPMAEFLAENTISLPVHEFVSSDEIEFMSSAVKDYYSSK